MADISTKRQKALESVADQLGISKDDLLNLEKAPDAVKENEAAFEEWSRLKEAKRAWQEEAQQAEGKTKPAEPKKETTSPERVEAESRFSKIQARAQEEIKAAEEAAAREKARPAAVPKEFKTQTIGSTDFTLKGEPYIPQKGLTALPAVGQTTAAIDEAARESAAAASAKAANEAAVKASEKAASKIVAPEAAEVAEAVAKGASKLSGKAKLLGLGAAALAGGAAMLGSKSAEEKPSEETKLPEAGGRQRMKEEVARQLGVPVSELPANVIEEGKFGPLVNKEVMDQVKQKQLEETRSLNQLRRQAQEAGITGKEQPVVSIPGLLPPVPPTQKRAVTLVPGGMKVLGAADTPEDKSKAADAVVTPILKEVTEESSPELQTIAERMKELQAEKTKALNEYNQRKDRIANAELIDAIGKGLAQLVAGWYGMETGRDAVTGVDFKPKDWTNKYLLAEKEYKNKLDVLQPEETALAQERKEMRTEARAEKAFERRVGEAERREETARKKRAEEEQKKELGAKQKLTQELAGKLELLKQTSGKDKKKAEAEFRETLGKIGVASPEIEKIMDAYKSPIIGYDYSPLEDIIKELQGPTKIPGQPASGQPSAPASGKIRVRRKSDGSTGTMNAADFDPAKYDRI